jgi:hypothetical protein
VDIHLNDLLGDKVGVANVCVFDHATACTGSIDATENYWGCPAGPGGPGCTTTSGPNVRFAPSLHKSSDSDEGDHEAANPGLILEGPRPFPLFLPRSS